MRVLHVDDDDVDHRLFKRLTRRLDLDLSHASTLADARARLGDGTDWDLVVVDHLLPDGESLDLLRELKVLRPDLPAIVLTNHAGALQGDSEARSLSRGVQEKAALTEERLRALLEDLRSR